MSEELTGPASPAAEGDYLSAAANWLALAEENTQTWQDPRMGMQDRTDARMTVSVFGRLAELNIALATACGTYHDRQPRRFAIDSTAVIREQLAADQAAHEAVRLTGADPDPESTDGDLWIDNDPDHGEYRFLYKFGPGHWAWVKSHTEALRLGYPHYTGEPWPEAVGARIVRRPDAAEREEFYAPPESTPMQPAETPCDCCASGLFTASAVHDEICGDCGHAGGRHNGNAVQQPGASPIPVRHVQAEEQRKAVQELSDQEFEDMLTLAEEERLRRQSENGVAIQPRRQRTPSGTPGVDQWRG